MLKSFSLLKLLFFNIMANTFKSDDTALDLLQSITGKLDFTVPNVDFDDPYFQLTPDLLKLLHDPVDKLTVDTITVRQIDGSGIFDGFMKTFSVHLIDEYKNKRLTGAEYAKAYTALAGLAMQCAVQFALGKDKAFWDAINSQIGAINANVNNAMAKVQLAIAQAQAHQNRANYALTVEKLATEDAQYALVKENYEATRAQTLDTRSDNQKVVGSIGKQKDLYTKQIWAYERDAECKAAQIFSNAWITQKGIDEGLLAPANLQNAAVNDVLSVMRRNVGLQ